MNIITVSTDVLGGRAMNQPPEGSSEHVDPGKLAAQDMESWKNWQKPSYV